MAYTPDNNPYIPGDPYSYDLKWIVDKMKTYEDPQKYADAAAASAAESAASAEESEAYKTDAYSAKNSAQASADIAQAAAENVHNAVENATAPIINDVVVLSARVDSFEQLAEGSTTGDAELIDARIGADGHTWPNAGDAIRGQVDQLNINDEYLSKAISLASGKKFIMFQQGYWRIRGVGDTADNAPIISDANYSSYECAQIAISEGDQIVLNGYGTSGIYRLYQILDSNREVIARSSTNIGGRRVITAPAGAAYMQINFWKATPHYAYVNVTEEGEINLAGVYTSNQTFEIPFTGDNDNQIFESLAEYDQVGTQELPTIKFMIGSGLNGTTEFVIGDLNNPIVQQWRMMRYPTDQTKITVYLTVPTGVTLTIHRLANTFSNNISGYDNGIKIAGHRRIPFCPWDSYASAMMAAKAGMRYFIEIPKRLSDGVWICYHDDTLVYNDTYIRQADGSELPATYNGTPWSSISYSTARTWDWGISKNVRFTGTKPLTLDDFFKLCSKTGMHPMLSLHPFPNASQLNEIKDLAKKFGVLKNLTLKTSTSNPISSLYAVFGNEIEQYVYNVPAGAQTQAVIESVISSMQALSGCTVERTIELFSSTAFDAYFISSYTPFELITAAGFTASIAHQNGAFSPYDNGGTSHSYILGYDYTWWAYNHGVTSFVDEHNWNDGLNW